MPRYKNAETGAIVNVPTIPAWGEWVEIDNPTTIEDVPVDADAPRDTPGIALPGQRATVRDWVEFMAANGIEHPEDATKSEMRAIAIEHFEQ